MIPYTRRKIYQAPIVSCFAEMLISGSDVSGVERKSRSVTKRKEFEARNRMGTGRPRFCIGCETDL
jgi:hypothetical protein